MHDKAEIPPGSGSDEHEEPQVNPDRRRSYKWKVLGGGAALVVIVCVILLALALLDARSALKNGVARLQDVQARLQTSGKHGTDAATYAYIKERVDVSASDFRRAHDRLGPITPVLHVLGWVPRVGGEMAASPEIASMADATGQGLRSLLSGMTPVVKAGSSSSHVNISALLPKIAGQAPAFRSACSSFDHAGSLRRTISPTGLGSLASQLHTFDHVITQLRVTCRAMIVLPAILGYPRSRTYLLVYQNPAELRAAGGFIGSAGILRFEQGKVIQQFHGTGFKDENFTVPSPEPVQYYNTEPYWLFRDSNWSPNFPTTAALERYFLRLDLHRSVVGTINITPEVAQTALAVIGPQYIQQYHQLVTSDNVAQMADYYANWATTPVPGVSANSDIQGKQFINLVAQRLLFRLEHLPARTWINLIQGLGAAVQQKQIQINFLNPEDQQLVTMMHADGAMSSTTTDYLYVVDTNLSYNKVNPYVHQQISYSVQVRKDRWLQSTLTLHFENDTPSTLAREGIGPGAGRLGGPTDYADFVRIYVPAGAQLTTQSGWWQLWDPGPAYGRTMFCGYLLIPHGRKATVRMTYVVPPNVFKSTHGSRYVLYVQHQAGSHPDSIQVRVQGSGVSDRTWSLQHPLMDETLPTSIDKRPFTAIPLPAQPPTVVAPGHWIEPHAYLSAPRTTHR